MVQCPSCGGGLRFDIASQRMQCDYCGSQYDPAALQDNVSDDAKTQKTYEGYVYICPSCGGELMTTDQNDAVGFCPFCGGASMIFDKVRKDWQPDYVIPFKVTKEQCKKTYLKEVKRRFFVSRKYRDPQLIDSFRGIYMPYWTYVAEHKGAFTTEVKEKERYVGSSTYETDVYTVYADIDMTVEGYTHDASAAFDDSLSEAIAPFDETARKLFAPGYLSGFYAEAADVSETNFHSQAEEELQEYAIKALNENPELSQMLKDKDLKIDKTKTTVPTKIISAKRVLRPVWFMSYRNKDKITYAVVNGQTGKISADLPLSPVRILVTALIVTVALFALLFAGMSILPSIKGGPTLAIGLLILMFGLYFTRKSFCFSMEEYFTNGADYGYNDSLGDVYKVPEREKKFITPIDVILIILSVFGLLMIVTDGTYSGGGRSFGSIFLFLTVIALIVKTVKLGGDFKAIKKAIKETPGAFRAGTADEALKLIRSESWLRIVSYVSLVIAWILIVIDPPLLWLLYGFAGVLMLELFGLVIYTVLFQSNVAKRLPPQFRKKGALYDEK